MNAELTERLMEAAGDALRMLNHNQVTCNDARRLARAVLDGGLTAHGVLDFLEIAEAAYDYLYENESSVTLGNLYAIHANECFDLRGLIEEFIS
jgi:hypothetical protein